MELKIMKERVISASEKCSTAKNILMELFPEAFKEDESWEDVTSLCDLGEYDEDIEGYEDRVGVGVPLPGITDNFYKPFSLDDSWKGKRNAEGRPLIDGYAFKIKGGKILRRKEEE
jgi:hypothetical protein